YDVWSALLKGLHCTRLSDARSADQKVESVHAFLPVHRAHRFTVTRTKLQNNGPCLSTWSGAGPKCPMPACPAPPDADMGRDSRSNITRSRALGRSRASIASESGSRQNTLRLACGRLGRERFAGGRISLGWNPAGESLRSSGTLEHALRFRGALFSLTSSRIKAHPSRPHPGGHALCDALFGVIWMAFRGSVPQSTCRALGASEPSRQSRASVGLKILHIANEVVDTGNGICNSAVDLACHQAMLGHDVWFVSSGGAYIDLLSRHRVRHFSIHQYPRDPIKL